MSNYDTIISATTKIVDSLSSVSKVFEPTIIIIKDTIVNNSEMLKKTDSAIDINISAWLIIAFLGIGIGLYFLLTFLKKYILPVFVQQYKKNNIHLFWYRFNVAIWLVFSLLSLYVFLKSSVLITSLILTFTGLTFYHFIIDFIIGVYFQFENHIKVNNHFILNDIEGEVQGFYNRHLKVLTTQNEETFIPYRNFIKNPIRIVKQVDSLIQKSFVITMAGEITENTQILHKYMIMCPWIYDSKLFKIEHVKNDHYQIFFRVKEDFTAHKIESYIQSKIN